MPTTISSTGITFPDSTSLTTNPIPAGTRWFFHQTNAPTGWTKVTTHNDKALRVVSGTASSGGGVNFTTVLTNRNPSGTVFYDLVESNGGGPFNSHGANLVVSTDTANISTVGGSPATPVTSLSIPLHSHTITPANHNHNQVSVNVNLDTMNFSVNYVDVIIATKD